MDACINPRVTLPPSPAKRKLKLHGIKIHFHSESTGVRMYHVGEIVNLPVIDHLIITERKYYSFKNSGLLDEIAKSQKYVVRYKKEEERLKNLGRQEGREEKAVEMAKVLKKSGVDAGLIARASGLSKEQIKKL